MDGNSHITIVMMYICSMLQCASYGKCQQKETRAERGSLSNNLSLHQTRQVDNNSKEGNDPMLQRSSLNKYNTHTTEKKSIRKRIEGMEITYSIETRAIALLLRNGTRNLAGCFRFASLMGFKWVPEIAEKGFISTKQPCVLLKIGKRIYENTRRYIQRINSHDGINDNNANMVYNNRHGSCLRACEVLI